MLPDPEYRDEKGRLHVLCACGHYVSGSVKPGDKILLCPNCRLRLRLEGSIPLPYPGQVPANTQDEQARGSAAPPASP